MPNEARNVFINSAFDRTFQPLFHAIVFAILRSGFQVRCALETDDGSENRLTKILNIIEDCRYGIHDLSRTESDGEPPLPRFNMPLELGLFLGAKRYGDPTQRRKQALILDTEQYRYQRFISDIAGQDIHAHGGDPAHAIVQVATWLRLQSNTTTIPGGRHIVQEFADFQHELAAILERRNLHQSEMSFGDYTRIVYAYLDQV